MQLEVDGVAVEGGRYDDQWPRAALESIYNDTKHFTIPYQVSHGRFIRDVLSKRPRFQIPTQSLMIIARPGGPSQIRPLRFEL